MPRRTISFFVTFVNTTGREQEYRWIVYLYRMSDPKQRMGETTPLVTRIPAGTSEQHGGGVWQTGIDCQDYILRVAWLDAIGAPTIFKRPDGSTYELPFGVCP